MNEELHEGDGFGYFDDVNSNDVFECRAILGEENLS